MKQYSQNCTLKLSMNQTKKKGSKATLKHKPVFAKVGGHGNNFRLLSTS